MTQGILRYDTSTDRFDALDKHGESLTFGGFCCGYPLEVEINGKWEPTRIEFCHDTESWYLVGFKNHVNLNGLKVRFS